MRHGLQFVVRASNLNVCPPYFFTWYLYFYCIFRIMCHWLANCNLTHVLSMTQLLIYLFGVLTIIGHKSWTFDCLVSVEFIKANIVMSIAILSLFIYVPICGIIACVVSGSRLPIHRDHSVHVPSQWETTLHCNVVSHWLGAYTKSSLNTINSLYFNGCTVVKVWEWITNFFPHFIIDVITYPCWH